ncbi:peptidoglycan-binding protein [Thiocystis violacea]|uniref:peptidoglycan-binding protein n=1 Tax=Thiocystis violacea TaxID=13725 RepID=UPI00190768FD|nr:peptidoglycan-binding protein [Thiocystis violacea]
MQNLKWGSNGPAVRDLQARLNLVQKPLPPLVVDGIFGPKTDAAVRAFQTRACPPVDGIVGPKTRAALAAAKPNVTPPIQLHYVVPAYLHIAQDKTMSCWYASAQMLIQWKRERTRMTDPRHPDPSESPKWSKLYSDNTGITNAKIREFARDMGFAHVPPMSPTPEAILGWLRIHGPLWVNGVRHITVIAGIRGPRDDTEVLVLDPGRKTEIKGAWRNLRQWYVLDKHSGRDTSKEVEAVFLRLP